MTIEELNDCLDALAALPPDWDLGYKGTTGMTVSKAACAHARAVGVALLGAGHTSFQPAPHWLDEAPAYLVALETDDWTVVVHEDGATAAHCWCAHTTGSNEYDPHVLEQDFPAGATAALCAWLTQHAPR